MSNNRLEQIDNLRVIAIMGVVLIHTTTRILERTGYDLNIYHLTLYLNQISRFAVPLFFLISGFVLELTSGISFNFNSYINKRFSKIIIPYIFWSLFYYYFIYTNNGNNLLQVILTGTASYQLYFIPTLCVYYLIFPLLHKYFKYISLPIIMVLLSLLQIKLLYSDYFIKNIQFTDAIRIGILGLFYFIVGMVSSHYRDIVISISKKWKVLLGILFILLGYYIFREGNREYFRTFNINAFYSSWRPSILVYTLVSGMFFVSIFKKLNLQRFSKLSFFVFFVHTLILELVWKYIGQLITPNLLFSLFFYLLVLGISFAIAFMVHKISGLSKITG